MESEEPKDDEDELAALMIASTTVRKRKLDVGSAINTKRRKQLKDLAVLASSDNALQSEKEQNFAVAYFSKLKEQLDEVSFLKIVKLLSNFNGTSEGVVELFKEMSSMLPASLAEEFLYFLTPVQAHFCGKFMDHLVLSKMTDFFRKFEVCFVKQPQMVRKLYDVLCQLASCENVTLQQVKDSVLPLLKSKTFLLEYFLQLFPDERPPDNIVLDDFEEIYLDGDCWNEEEIRIVDNEDSTHCPCSCHPTHLTHCTRCSVKYINGRVYIQTGRALRAARIEFNGQNPADVLRRVCVNNEESTPKVKQGRRRVDTPNQKDHSPVKHAFSPHATTTESEDELSEVRNSNSSNKPKFARSLKQKFKSQEKIPSRSKCQAMDEIHDNLKVTIDENAVLETVSSHLWAEQLSPERSINKNSLNFDNVVFSDVKNKLNKNASLSSPSSFTINLKQNPSRSGNQRNQDLIIAEGSQNLGSEKKLNSPLKDMDSDASLEHPFEVKAADKNASSSNSFLKNQVKLSGVSSTESFDRFIPEIKHQNNSSYLSTKKIKSEVCLAATSESMSSIFTPSVVDEMDLLLASSNIENISSLDDPTEESSVHVQHNISKYSDSTLDSISIDSLLNISNLDSKIDSLINSSMEERTLDTILNASPDDMDSIISVPHLNENQSSKVDEIKVDEIKVDDEHKENSNQNIESVEAIVSDLKTNLDIQSEMQLKVESASSDCETCNDNIISQSKNQEATLDIGKNGENEVESSSKPIEENIISRTDIMHNDLNVSVEDMESNTFSSKESPNSNKESYKIESSKTECNEIMDKIKTSDEESLHVTPEPVANHSELCGVSPKENQALSDTSCQDNSESNEISLCENQCNDWTMEEDKIILQTFQKDPDMQDIFSTIKNKLPDRSLSEVQSRFYVLIELLEKMSNNSNSEQK